MTYPTTTLKAADVHAGDVLAEGRTITGRTMTDEGLRLELSDGSTWPEAGGLGADDHVCVADYPRLVRASWEATSLSAPMTRALDSLATGTVVTGVTRSTTDALLRRGLLGPDGALTLVGYLAHARLLVARDDLPPLDYRSAQAQACVRGELSDPLSLAVVATRVAPSSYGGHSHYPRRDLVVGTVVRHLALTLTLPGAVEVRAASSGGAVQVPSSLLSSSGEDVKGGAVLPGSGPHVGVQVGTVGGGVDTLATCLCPDDCGCRSPHRTTVCGCRGHEVPVVGRLEVASLRTACAHPLDCRLYVSTELWRDAPYALGQDTAGWVYVSPGSDEYRAVAGHFAPYGGLPQHPGEYVDTSSADDDEVAFLAVTGAGDDEDAGEVLTYRAAVDRVREASRELEADGWEIEVGLAAEGNLYCNRATRAGHAPRVLLVERVQEDPEEDTSEDRAADPDDESIHCPACVGVRAHTSDCPSHEARVERAREMGREAARSAAQTAADGVDATRAREVLVLIEGEGVADPEDLPLPCTPDLSGEWADDLTPVRLWEAITGEAHADAAERAGLAYETLVGLAVDAYAQAWEEGVSETFYDACAAELKKVLPDAETGGKLTDRARWWKANAAGGPLTSSQALSYARTEESYRVQGERFGEWRFEAPNGQPLPRGTFAYADLTDGSQPDGLVVRLSIGDDDQPVDWGDCEPTPAERRAARSFYAAVVVLDAEGAELFHDGVGGVDVIDLPGYMQRDWQDAAHYAWTEHLMPSVEEFLRDDPVPAEPAADRLTDALADLLHELDGDGAAVRARVEDRLTMAEVHYAAERGRAVDELAANLNDRMEFDHVVEVRKDGTIIDRDDIYAPECHDDGRAGIDFAGAKGWTALDGYSGQDRYSGPIMHQSEYVGGRMAHDIASTPGIYVVVVVTDVSTEECEPSGWAVLKRVPEADEATCPGHDQAGH